MKIIKNKAIIIVLLIILICNLILPQQVFATEFSNDESEETSMSNGYFGIPIIGGAVNIILSAVKLGIVIPGLIVNGISTGISNMGRDYRGADEGGVLVSLNTILFNHLAITDINILEYNWGRDLRNTFDSSTGLGKMRNNIATWYVGIRNLAVVILLCVLIYVGIRMVISTVAEDKAKYKQLLLNWVVGLALVFVLHFLIIFVVYLNSALVAIIETASGTADNSQLIESYNSFLLAKAFNTESLGNFLGTYIGGNLAGVPASFASALIYTILSATTFAFLMMYIRRMITVSFYIIIAPLITITYPIDKIGDRKVTSVKYLA